MRYLGEHELTDDDMDHISAFALRMEGSGLPRSTYNNLRRFFRHKLNMDTEYRVVGRVRRGNEWGIVDRSGDYARTVFVDPVQQEEQ
jgi:hypothetical protein